MEIPEILKEILQEISNPTNLSENLEISLEIWKSFAKLEILYACGVSGGPLVYRDDRGLSMNLFRHLLVLFIFVYYTTV